MISDNPYGFRIVGNYRNDRRLVDATAAIAGYAACDQRAEVDREAYLSAFQFGDAFRRHLETTGSTKNYCGPCWARWLWFDIDRENDLTAATTDTRRLAASLVDRYGLDGDDLLIFFSGSKGFHIGLSTWLWRPGPGETFHLHARRFAERAAERVSVAIDTGVYDRVRAFRAPNSRHPKTSLHKRRLAFDELLHLTPEAITNLASEPKPFDLPTITGAAHDQATADWQEAAVELTAEATARRERKANGLATLNRATLDFIREGASVGDRHRLLFSAAANLAEFGCPLALAYALLTESGLDSGLSPSDVRRQTECGLKSVSAKMTPEDASESTFAVQSDSIDQEGKKRDTGDSGASGNDSCQQLTGETWKGGAT